MARYILALDQGTTSSRAIVFDHMGRPCSTARRDLTQHFPEPGWVEHDPDEIWNGQLAAAREAIAAAGIGADEIAGIGITNQRETTLLWERSTGRPLHRAIVWQDRRTATHINRLRATGDDETIVARTGLIPDAYFSATKIAWLLDNVPGARAAAERGDVAFGTVDSWLLYRLTGGRVHATDRTNASRTMLYNLEAESWDPALLRLFNIPQAVLPEVRRSAGRFGATDPALFAGPLPITGVAGDQQAALAGHGCFAAGLAKNTYGTGGFLLLHTGGKQPAGLGGLLTTAAASLTDTPAYALEGSIFVAGAAVQWLRDGLGIIGSAAESEALAESVPDSGGVVVVPAFAGLGAPHWDQYARGSILGITRGTTRAHIVRATLDAIALQTVDVVRAMEAASGEQMAELRVDGGAAANDFLMQLQADVLQRPVIRPRFLETTAMGAALLAGCGAGMWDRAGELSVGGDGERRFLPRMGDIAHSALIRSWERGVERARGWADEHD